jgi:ubiquinone/menaquinone biosynthesis C-methylase UbiE
MQPNPCPCCWNQRLFAWMMAKSTDSYNEIVGERKQQLFANLQGNVLEIGPGTGANFAYYPPNIHWIGVEPNLYMHSYLEQEVKKAGIDGEIRQGNAQHLEAADNSVDAVISTLVLCSVPNLSATLQEVLRVLKPGGKFYFLEHVAAPEGTFLRKVQSFLRPAWKFLADGCHPDRETWNAIEKAGFHQVDYEKFAPDLPLPVVAPHIAGVAVK